MKAAQGRADRAERRFGVVRKQPRSERVDRVIVSQGSEDPTVIRHQRQPDRNT